jgi:hypothetical protein
MINANEQYRRSGLLLMTVTIEYVTLFSTKSGWLVLQDERLYSVKNADFTGNQWLTMVAALQSLGKTMKERADPPTYPTESQ